MTRQLTILLAATAILAPGPIHAQPQSPPSVELPPALERVLRDYEVAWRAQDADALAALFHPDGFVMSPGQPPVRGREAIGAHYQGRGGPLALRALDYAAEADVGWIIGGYARAPGEPDVGKFSLTLRRVDGRWLIVTDMDNGNG
ncbi:MAG TPA: nuclear transport factor 2 family protein [Candidatus Thermoplasmatota archaeon]